MKKILCLIDSLGAGGAQRQMVGLATLLKEKGYDVTVVIYHQNLFYADELSSKGVPFLFLTSAHNTYRRLFSVAGYIKKTKPDVVISYLDVPNICGCFAKLLNRNFRLIVSERNTSQQTGKKERIRFNLFRMADSVIPNSFSQAEYIRKNFHFLEKKVMTIPNFVDLERFKPSFHQRHDVPEIIIAATIWPSKNTLGFIDAVKILAQKGLKFHVSWYGKNTAYIDYFNACKNKIDEKGVGNYICLLEKTDKITDRYKEADYFCLPSFYEGTPNVICEAMASGMPIMCSEVCDNSRYVQEGVNGTLFNPKDAESIAHKIEKMLGASDAEYEHFCNRSREMAENKLSKERFINDYVNLIEE